MMDQPIDSVPQVVVSEEHVHTPQGGGRGEQGVGGCAVSATHRHVGAGATHGGRLYTLDVYTVHVHTRVHVCFTKNGGLLTRGFKTLKACFFFFNRRGTHEAGGEWFKKNTDESFFSRLFKRGA